MAELPSRRSARRRSLSGAAGNLVLGHGTDTAMLGRLVDGGSADGAQIWPQLGHAGALGRGPVADPAGPSALDLDGLGCDALTPSYIGAYARAAARARTAGFGGVQIDAGHGFLLSQFLPPLFSHRSDRDGGPIEARREAERIRTWERAFDAPSRQPVAEHRVRRPDLDTQVAHDRAARTVMSKVWPAAMTATCRGAERP